MNHIQHMSLWKVALKRSHSNPDISFNLPETRQMTQRLRRCDTDTCLLPTLATPGQDLFEIKDLSSTFHTLPRKEEEGVSIVIIDADGNSRHVRTESGAFGTDIDAISNASLQTLSK
jgi:hypothetical protein